MVCTRQAVVVSAGGSGNVFGQRYGDGKFLISRLRERMD